MVNLVQHLENKGIIKELRGLIGYKYEEPTKVGGFNLKESETKVPLQLSEYLSNRKDIEKQFVGIEIELLINIYEIFECYESIQEKQKEIIKINGHVRSIIEQISLVR